ncbi:MAG: transposase [Clostridium sp.]|nr:transposase [Clostridium sp.]
MLEFDITSGNIHDSVGFIGLYEKLKDRFSTDEIIAIAMDAGYITPYICKQLFTDNILPVLHYKRPMTKEGVFKKHDYVFYEANDCYICPNFKILKYSTTNRDGYREYKSNPCECSKCPYLDKCTNSKNHQKVITQHIWKEFVDEANHLRHDKYVKFVYKACKETIERVFADAKEKHGMRYTHLRSLAKVTIEVTLIYACMNLKKMANHLWKKRGSYRSDSPLNHSPIKMYKLSLRIIAKSIFSNLEYVNNFV